MLSRRQALTAAANVVAGLAGGALAPRPAAASLLSAFASPNRIPYGACVRPIPLQNELDYRNLLQTYCQQLTPEGGLFWGYLRPTAGEFRFDFADGVLAFAEAEQHDHGRAHVGLVRPRCRIGPRSIEGAPPTPSRAMTDRTSDVTMCPRYRGKIENLARRQRADRRLQGRHSRPAAERQVVWSRSRRQIHRPCVPHRAPHRSGRKTLSPTNTIWNVTIGHFAEKAQRPCAGSFHSLLDRGVPLHRASACRATSAVKISDRPRRRLLPTSSPRNCTGLVSAVRVTELDVIDKELPGPIAPFVTPSSPRAPTISSTPVFAAVASRKPSVIATTGASPTATPGCRSGTSAATGTCQTGRCRSTPIANRSRCGT